MSVTIGSMGPGEDGWETLVALNREIALLDDQVPCEADPVKWSLPQPPEGVVQACQGCPVVAACRAHGEAVPFESGTWGGTSERDRFEVHRAQRRAERAAKRREAS